MVALEQVPAADQAGVAQAVAEHGACIATGVLDAAQCEALLADFQPQLDAMPWGLDELGYASDFYGRRTKRLHGLFSASPKSVDVLTHPLFTGLARELFVDSGMAHDIRLSNAELMVIAGGQTPQAFHRDATSWARMQAAEDGEILVSANVALTDFTATNGATRVVPGSHRWPMDREPEDHEVCLAVMARGSALIYGGNAVHSGGASSEDVARVGLYLGFIPSWLRPIENQLVTNRPEDVHALPEDAKRLLDVSEGGFTVYA